MRSTVTQSTDLYGLKLGPDRVRSVNARQLRTLGFSLVVVLLLLASRAYGQVGGLFASRASAVGFGRTAVSPDGKLRVSVVASGGDDGWPTTLRLEAGSRVLERQFDFGLNAQVLWSPNGSSFAVTGSNGGAVGQFETAIVSVGEHSLAWLDVTRTIERAFGKPVKCDWPEPPNVGAVAWLSESQLLIAAEIMPHSNCDSMGTFVLYRLALPSRRVERRYGQLEAKRRWPKLLGVELLGADDECVRTPRSCFVPINHPDRKTRR